MIYLSHCEDLEAVVKKFSKEKLFWKIYQNSQEAAVLELKLADLQPAAFLLKKDYSADVLH